MKFFGQIRRRLVNDNQLTKYLKYAFGEIVLVVVGILIALQLNNWNEQRSKDRKADKILVLMQDELLDAVVTIDRQRNSYRRKD